VTAAGNERCRLPQRFDGPAVTAAGNVCVGTLMTGHITVVSLAGEVLRQAATPDIYPTNICFGGPGMRTDYISLSETGGLLAMDWPEPGLQLHDAR
jgi:gluconolactonase